jgi:hypothetical protein
VPWPLTFSVREEYDNLAVLTTRKRSWGECGWSEEAFVLGIIYLPYIEPIGNLGLYNRGETGQAKALTQSISLSGYYKYSDRGVLPRLGYPDWAVQPDSYDRYPDRGGSACLLNLRKWPIHDTRKFRTLLEIEYEFSLPNWLSNITLL